MPVPGLLHKYHGRVLLTLTGACAVHCRYCFRRHFPYADASPTRINWGYVYDYLQNNTDVHEVILSGGDPLTWPDERLANTGEPACGHSPSATSPCSHAAAGGCSQPGDR